MATDVLTIGGIVFDSWQAPPNAPYGGKQAMAVHKLPGGARVVDTLGPDDEDINFTGLIYGPNAASFAATLDALRVSGQTVPLSFVGRSYSVIVKQAVMTFVKYPAYARYNISCLVVVDPQVGIIGTILTSLTNIVSADLATVMSIVGL